MSSSLQNHNIRKKEEWVMKASDVTDMHTSTNTVNSHATYAHLKNSNVWGTFIIHSHYFVYPCMALKTAKLWPQNITRSSHMLR